MIKKTIYFGNPAFLSIKNKQLVIQFPAQKENEEPKKKLQFWEIEETNNEEKIITIPIEDIGYVIIDHQQITLTQPLIAGLVENNVALISCDNSHLPTGMLLALHSNTLQSERYKNQLNASEPLKKQLWSQIIQKKIENQAAVLKQTNPQSNYLKLIKLSKTIKSGDSTNREGVASALYWKEIFPKIDNFLRDRDGAPPNNLLNYGYALVRASTARGLVAAGLLPTLGLHHHNRYNPYCLADDLMEPFRPFVDYYIYKLLETSNFEQLSLTKEIKTKLLSLLVIDIELDGETSPLTIAVQKTCQSLNKCFSKIQRKLLLPTFNYE
jgi:CRISPR-associated protein Cas1